MPNILLPQQQKQLDSFWNLILASDTVVQQGLLFLLANKYNQQELSTKSDSLPFLKLQGRLKVQGDAVTDQRILNEYLQEKYNV